MNWYILIPILLWLLKFIINYLPSQKQEEKFRKALKIMEEIKAQANKKGITADSSYTLQEMLK